MDRLPALSIVQQFICCFRALFATLVSVLFLISPFNVEAHDLRDLVAKVKPSIVGIGTHEKTRSPSSRLMGTGFIVGDGTLVATNSHVVPSSLNDERFERVVVFSGSGNKPKVYPATLVARDEHHDLALLRVLESIGPSVTFADSEQVAEGTAVLFSGFPIGAVLGLYPASHHGIVSAITPIAIPANSGRELTTQRIRMIRDGYKVFQLDATAYPGNSGSPVFEANSGKVIGIVNKVFVKGSKETAITAPSAITYAVPGNFLRELMRKN